MRRHREWDGVSYYILLQIPPSATEQDVKAAWRKFAAIYHPDRNPGNETLFSQIRIAYKVLSVRGLRVEYDRFTELIGIDHTDQTTSPHPTIPTRQRQSSDSTKNDSEKKEYVVGIDLGTTNTVAAILTRGEPEVIPNAEGGRLTPSVVSFSKDKGTLVGALAKRQKIAYSKNTVASVKRRMGSNWSHQYNGSRYTAVDISAKIIEKVKQDTEAYLGVPVKKAVITVPAYFNHNQRQATKEAGQKAGLKVLRIINEPTAAAVAFSVQDQNESGKYLIFDLGGGTFDVTILEEEGDTLEVIATHGDTKLGGDDWDQALMLRLLEVFRKQTGMDVSNDLTALQRLRDESERAKIELSTLEQTHINIPFLAANDKGPQHLDYELTRKEFEALTGDLLQRCRSPFTQVMTDSGLGIDQIDHIVLAGGSTRMPAVRNLVKQLTGREPLHKIHPEEAIALGAAIQGGILTGDIDDLILLDVTSLSLGVETEGRVTQFMIERNTSVPTEVSKLFSTASDNQTEVEIHVVQGENESVDLNHTLAKFDLKVDPAPARTPQIQVTFQLTVDGTLSVSAYDLDTGRNQRIQITEGNILTRDEEPSFR